MVAAIVYSDISDHLPVVLCVDLQIKKIKLCKEYPKRLYSNESIESFKLALSSVDWSKDYNQTVSIENCNLMYNKFLEMFTTIFNDHFPLRSFKLSKSKTPRQEWITSGLIKSCNRKSTLYKKYKKNCIQKIKIKIHAIIIN